MHFINTNMYIQSMGVTSHTQARPSFQSGDYISLTLIEVHQTSIV